MEGFRKDTPIARIPGRTADGARARGDGNGRREEDN
jgi:hypothetical protein